MDTAASVMRPARPAQGLVGTPGYQSLVGVLIRTQEKRDQAAAEAAAKRAALEALPRAAAARHHPGGHRERRPSPDNLRFMSTPLAICGLPIGACQKGRASTCANRAACAWW